MNYPMKKKGLSILLTKKNELVFHLNGDTIVQYNDNVEFLKELFLLIDGSLSINEIIDELRRKGYDVEKDELIDLLFQFESYNLVEDKIELDFGALTERDLIKYDRQLNCFATFGKNKLQDSIKFQNKIKNSHVLVIGAGGVGSHALYSLVAMGIGTVSFIDFDKIELSNTSRQILFDESDVGKYKVEVAKEKLSKVNSYTQINAIEKKVESVSELLEVIGEMSINIILLCADTPRGKIIDIIDEVAQERSIPYITAYPLSEEIIVGPLLIPGKTKRHRDLVGYYLNQDDDTISALQDQMSATIIEPYNALAAQIATLEIVKYISEFSQPTLIEKSIKINTNNWTINWDNYEGEKC